MEAGAGAIFKVQKNCHSYHVRPNNGMQLTYKSGGINQYVRSINLVWPELAGGYLTQ
ncbi:MAG: hypothetical protein DHS20C01_27040 [marine bacterium B5-7]|nr:MAG: hypothetical protein DHS20C01_27040 [marine bacterium B5-7]